MAENGPPPIQIVELQAELFQFLDALHIVWGLLIVRLFNLLGRDLANCPFVAILLATYLYNLIF